MDVKYFHTVAVTMVKNRITLAEYYTLLQFTLSRYSKQRRKSDALYIETCLEIITLSPVFPKIANATFVKCFYF